MDELRDKIAAEIYWVGRFTEGDKHVIAERILALPELQRVLGIAKDYDEAKLGPSV